tara:strand:+ start:141 stop:335 length:195 start_codon:yes stop_codon:yes gene_type:complete
MEEYTIIDCDICFKKFRCYGTLGGSAVCNKCHPAFQFGYEQERSNWEKWIGKSFLEMWREHESK